MDHEAATLTTDSEAIIDRYLRAVHDQQTLGVAVDDELTSAFVEVARPFADERGISYGAWREAGVPVAVLQRANIRPRRRRQ
jgi:hypothetical protein